MQLWFFSVVSLCMIYQFEKVCWIIWHNLLKQQSKQSLHIVLMRKLDCFQCCQKRTVLWLQLVAAHNKSYLWKENNRLVLEWWSTVHEMMSILISTHAVYYISHLRYIIHLISCEYVCVGTSLIKWTYSYIHSLLNNEN